MVKKMPAMLPTRRIYCKGCIKAKLHGQVVLNMIMRKKKKKKVMLRLQFRKKTLSPGNSFNKVLKEMS